MDTTARTACPPPPPVPQPALPQRQPSPIPVLLRVWGLTEADQDRAVREAGQGWGARNWEFVEIERLTGVPCPLPRYDPKALYADAGFGWAYVAYRANR